MTRRPRRHLSPRTAVLCALSFGVAAAGCILQDKEIEIRDEKILNRNPVRFAEPTVLSDDAERACDPKPNDMKPVGCTQPGTDPELALPHFLDPNYTVMGDEGPQRPWFFCTCPEGKVDGRILVNDLFVEDQDEEPRSRIPKDKIYAALLLDLKPGTDEPDEYLAYSDILDPQAPLDLYDQAYKPAYRRDPHLRQLFLGTTDNPLDPCNDAVPRLSVGPHSLTIMVTDRQWFSADKVPIQVGTPDLASGATFDTITYVFFCGDGTVEGNDCACVDENAGDEGGL